MHTIALVAYESRFARCGGVTAVLNHLPGHLQKASGEPTLVITPYHHQIRETAALATTVIGRMDFSFGGRILPIAVHRFDDRWPWIFIDAREAAVPEVWRIGVEDRQFFAGRRHPYDVGRGGAEQLAILRRDALLFGVAAARALPLIDARADWSLLLQDWQAATAALALAQTPNARLLLTLHNSYDSGGLPDDELRRAGIDPATTPGADGGEAATVLNRVWPIVNKPVVTVSQQFALDLTEDPFQVYVMADQLQGILAPPNLVGINNGPFAALAVPEQPLTAARDGDLAPLRGWKEERKRQAIAALRSFTPTAERVVWGDVTAFLRRSDEQDAAWFVLAGRDDPRQKGYDVAAAAVDDFLQNPLHAEAQFLFFPIPSDEGRAGLGFLQGLAERFPANVLVLPFIFVEGYQAALQGAAFGVMPSLYEPFGMANEFYLNGALGIGRATGGLVQQIVPLWEVPSYSPSVQRRSTRWHAAESAATGILFREPDDLPSLVEDWRQLNVAEYEMTPPDDRVAVRRRIPLYEAIVVALRQALADGLALYREAPGRERMLRMVVAGIEHTRKAFSWDKTAAAYVEHLRR